MSLSVIAGIVTFNPEIDRLTKNINSIKDQVEKIIIVDNNSNNRELLKSFESECIHVIYNEKNLGIATALNILMNWASEHRYRWVVTLDQDSVCNENYIKTAEPYLKLHDVGQIVPILYESQSSTFQYLGDKPINKEIQKVKKSITSAAITNVAIWEKIGKFDDEFFIDYVDYDYALRLNKHNYKILRLNNVRLDHQIGNSEMCGIGPIKVRVQNHSAFRKYYICRNIILFIRKHGWKSKPVIELLRLIKVFLFVVFFEEEKNTKTKAILKGIKDGVTFKLK